MSIVKAFEKATKTRKKSLDKSVGDKKELLPRRPASEQTPGKSKKKKKSK